MAVIRHKEAIHSGQFMVSEFEADEEDVEDIPEVVGDISNSIKDPPRGGLSQKPHHDKDFLSPQNKDNQHDPQWKGGGNRMLYLNNKKNLATEQYKDRNERGKSVDSGRDTSECSRTNRYFPIEAIRKKYERYPLLQVPKVQEHIDTDAVHQGTITNIGNTGTMVTHKRTIQARRSSGFANLPLIELFQSMSVAYRQKLTSPKWNRFKGLRLRWKDKIRLNNVIWRCWHLQYKEGRKKLLCAFANPLELENHKHTEAGPVVQGKYWKRKLDTIKIEYMRWRTWYHNDLNNAEGNKPAAGPSKEGKLKDINSSSIHVDRSRKISSSIPENQGKIGMLQHKDKLDLEKAISKDDWNLEQLLFDEDFLAENFPMDMQTPTSSLYDMGGDDYRNATNSDFFIPGLPSLQPNLFDIGIVDFDGDVMFNSINVGSSQSGGGGIQQQNPSVLNTMRADVTSSQQPEQHQLASIQQTPIIDPSQNAVHTLTSYIPPKRNLNPVNRNVTMVGHTKLNVSDGSTVHPVEDRLHLLHGQSSNCPTPIDMDNTKRQQHHESFSPMDAKISPNLAAATISNMKVTIHDDRSGNISKGQTSTYRSSEMHVGIPKDRQISPRHQNIMHNPSDPRFVDLNKEILYQPDSLQSSNDQVKLLRQNPPSTAYQNVIHYHHAKNTSAQGLSVAVTTRHSLSEQQPTSECIPDAKDNHILHHVAVPSTTENSSLVGEANSSSQHSQLVRLLRTNNKRGMPCEAFEPNKKLLLSGHTVRENSQTNPKINQSTSEPHTFSNNLGNVANSDVDGQHRNRYQDEFKLPLARQGNSHKSVLDMLQVPDSHQAAPAVLQLHPNERSRQRLRQAQLQPHGQIDMQNTKYERQTYLLQRQKELEQEQNFLARKEYSDNQYGQTNVSGLEDIKDTRDYRKFVHNIPRPNMEFSLQNSDMYSIGPSQETIKTERNDTASLQASSTLVQCKYANHARGMHALPNPVKRAPRQLIAIPQPPPSETQQSEITSLKSVSTINNYSKTPEAIERALMEKSGHNKATSFGIEERLSRQPSRGKGNEGQQNKSRRDIHINSEQNRRTSLKTGFDGLRQIIPGLNEINGIYIHISL